MATFNYSVRDKAGKVQKGSLEGESREAVSAKLRQMGFIILELDQQSALAALGQLKIGGGAVKPKDITIFSRQFATMINAGLSLTKCLSILASQTESEALRTIIGAISKDVESGQSLSESLGRHPKTFPPIFVNMVRAGETGGVLDEVLVRLADHFESEQALKGRVKSAMTYPIAMAALVLIILVAMMVFVVPTFEQMFASMGGELPFMTQVLVDISNFVAGIGGVITAIALFVAYFSFKFWKGTTSGRFIWDSFVLKAPVFGPLTRKVALARFTRTFGTLVSAGVPILSALDIVADTAGNEVVSREVRKARSAIKEGEAIAKPLSESKVFPSMLVQMIAVGEETGALDAMLNKIADFYDEEVAAQVDSLTSLIEPLMMASLGGVVGSMVVALYMPMFQVITLVQ
ncbi:MAG: type II secretion system F family protein [Actinobacteria bacterium]|nr:type II secretion system F family protein [Actinomycetota bacterium]MCL5887346.1 type II secretion system F family protein [Actinomycetota bacterium]